MRLEMIEVRVPLKLISFAPVVDIREIPPALLLDELRFLREQPVLFELVVLTYPGCFFGKPSF